MFSPLLLISASPELIHLYKVFSKGMSDIWNTVANWEKKKKGMRQGCLFASRQADASKKKWDVKGHPPGLLLDISPSQITNSWPHRPA